MGWKYTLLYIPHGSDNTIRNVQVENVGVVVFISHMVQIILKEMV